MLRQGWDIKDRYRTTTRPSMPEDETITSFGDRIIEVAGRVIAENGGGKIRRGDRDFYRIRLQKPANIETLPNVEKQLASLQSELKHEIKASLADGIPVQQQARAAYLAVCLDLTDPLGSEDRGQWIRALAALEQYPQLLDVLFHKSPGPAGDKLRAAATAAGLKKP